MAETAAVRTLFPVNVGVGERVASGLVGAALLANGIWRPSVASAALALGGGALVQRALSGHCLLYRALGVDKSGASTTHVGDTVSEASADSFPASDPPSWTPTSAIGAPS